MVVPSIRICEAQVAGAHSLLLSTGGGGGNILRSVKALFEQDLAVTRESRSPHKWNDCEPRWRRASSIPTSSH